MKFLVDVNLPKKFRFFNAPEFAFVVDLDPSLSDTDIWQYAMENNLVILTKDADFYTRALTAERRPKVIRLRLGNQTLSGLHDYFSNNWISLHRLIDVHSLLVAYPNRIDVVF